MDLPELLTSYRDLADELAQRKVALKTSRLTLNVWVDERASPLVHTTNPRTDKPYSYTAAVESVKLSPEYIDRRVTLAVGEAECERKGYELIALKIQMEHI